MSERDDHLVRLYDKKGTMYCVMVSPELWARAERSVAPHFERILDAMYPVNRDEPLDALKEFKDYWDFRYDYVPDVHCDHCGAKTDDWESDPVHPFILRNATLSGMLVFTCKACGAGIRKKHFKDKIQFECSPLCDCKK